MQRYGLVSIAKQFYAAASPAHRRVFWFLCVFNIILGFLEIGVAGCISLMSVSMTSPETLAQTPLLPEIVSALPFPESIPKALRMLAVLLAGVCGIIIGKNCLIAYVTWLQNYFGQGITWNLGTELFRRFLASPYLWHTRHNSADLLTLLNWKACIANFAVSGLTLFTQIVIAVFLLSGAIAVNPLLSCFLFCSIAGLAFAIQKYSRQRIYDLSSALCDYILYNSRVSMQGLQGIREITIYDKKHVACEEFQRDVPQFINKSSQQAIWPNIPQWVLESAGMGLLLIVLLCLMFTSVGIAEATGVLTLLAAVSWRLLPAANKLTSAVMAMRSEQPRVEKLLETYHETDTGASLLPRSVRRFERAIALENVSFSYPDTSQLALQDVSLTIPKGQMVGFVGLSGSGKSTLAGIITGLLQRNHGELQIDGSPWNPAQEHLNIGYVPQDLYLIDASLAENIAFSRWKEPLDETRVLKCCKMAAMDFVGDLPEGIHTVLGERGVRLSGGQIQRVGIARALYGNPDILLFDEATSALDGATENGIQQTIYSLRESVTMLLIAHRLSTVAKCDTIYWIDQGLVVASGAPQDVLPQYEAMMKERGAIGSTSQ